MKNLEKYFTPHAIKCMKENGISLKKLGNRLVAEEKVDLDKVFALNHRGKKSIYPDWVHQKAKENGIPKTTLYRRIDRGWPLELAVSAKSLRGLTHLKKRKKQVDPHKASQLEFLKNHCNQMSRSELAKKLGISKIDLLTIMREHSIANRSLEKDEAV